MVPHTPEPTYAPPVATGTFPPSILERPPKHVPYFSELGIDHEAD
jgi:hypothetical protein